MSDQVLDILKLSLLGLLYLFFARVLWAVWSEVRQPANVRVAEPMPQPAPTPSTGVPVPTGRRETKPSKGRRGTPGRLVTLEPKERRGMAFAITGQVTIGREGLEVNAKSIMGVMMLAAECR